MNLIKSFINTEITYFKKLHRNAQRLISAIMLFNLIGPIFAIFINSFLWRQSHDLTLVAFFNLLLMAFTPPGFYINGLLLKKFSPSFLHSLALGIVGITTSILIFMPSASYLTVSIFGIVNGTIGAMYWANRNLLTLKTTQSADRIYFSSIESSSANIANVFIPLFIGWFIAFGDILHFYSAHQAYQIVALAMLIVIVVIGFVANPISTKTHLNILLTKHPTSVWRKLRVVKFFYGLNNGILIFVPTLMILILVGNEDAVGTIQSLSSIMASIFIYIIAKYLDVKHRIALIAASTALYIIGGIVFGIFYSALSVSIFFACLALSGPLIWVATSSLSYDVMEKADIEHHYAYICDQEIYLNAGRVVAILLFIAAIYFGSNEIALRYSPLIVAVLQIFVMFFAKSTETHHRDKVVSSLI